MDDKLGNGPIKQFADAMVRATCDCKHRHGYVAMASREFVQALRVDIAASSAEIVANASVNQVLVRAMDSNPLHQGELFGVPVYLDPRMTDSTLEMVAL